ncbi:dehydrogenase [Rubrivivax sp. JA1026]|uniref:dehydrogenase n=1 Tax=Rubrivivax sp. JA1026 TaxID=2710888 RepID=UPI0013E96E12|nr:dehydrogenase [Rubrivivax sp. JA1026]
MKSVIGISLGAAAQDFELRTTLLGQPLRVRRIGTDGDETVAARRLAYWDRRAAAIGIGAGPDPRSVGATVGGAELAATLKHAPCTTGAHLAEIYLEWALRHVQADLGRYFDNALVLFFSGVANRKLASAMAEFTPNLFFADPLLQLGVPKLLTSLDALSLYATGSHYVAGWTPRRLPSTALLERWSDHVLRQAMKKATVVVAPVHELDRFGTEELAGKTIVTATVNDARLEAFREKGVAMIVDASPVVQGQVLGHELLDAMILAATGKAPGTLYDDDYLELIQMLDARPRVLYPNGFQRKNRFAFVIHPLSQEYFKKVKPIEMLSKVSPPLLMDSLEKAMAYAPPFVYSKVEGIKSPTGAEAEGWLISVGGTPREIMSHPPEFTYRRLLAAAEMARKLGAQIMGLGAFTKVVGDAGATVARRATLPITTGNSYSASGALWAAHDALLRLRLIEPPQGDERVKFKAMVVGATGAIGSACARLLVRAAEEVTLVSPETAKLLALQESILRQTPDAKIVLSAKADTHIADMDMIVTATSGAGKKVLDIMKVKPGCVITDVARPLDLSPEDVAKRPDVLVIESGEIQLPGHVKMKNIGLPPGVAYACLAETIVLALEGRFENFTVGRAIEWEKVREIYKLGLKHGMKLAAISGVNGVITDRDIARVRRLALAARKREAQADAPAAKPRRRARAAEAPPPSPSPAPAPKGSAKPRRATPAAAAPQPAVEGLGRRSRTRVRTEPVG